MGRTAVTAESYRVLEGALRSEIGLIRARDPFARVNVLVGSNLLGLSLKRRLAAEFGGLFNVHFLTFIDLVSYLDAASGAGMTASPPPLAEEVAAAEVLSTGIPPAVANVAGTKGFITALLATFDDLAEGGCTTALARRLARDGGALSAMTKDVLSLYARYRERLSGFGDDTHARFVRAIERFEAHRLETPLLVYGFYDFNEMQWRLIEAVAAGPGVVLFVPWSPDASDRFTARTLQRVERGGFTRARADERARLPRMPRETIVLEAAGEEDEVTEIVRMICSLAAGGVRFGEIGILLPAAATYLPLFQETLDEAGIPSFAREGRGPNENASLRSALRILDLAGGRIERRDLVDFLSASPLTPAFGGVEGCGAIELWLRGSADAGMVGAGGWFEENRRWIERLEASSTPRGEVRPDGPSGPRPPDRDEAQRLAAAARDVGTVLERLERARGIFAAAATWRSFAREYVSLVRDLLETSDEIERYCAIVEDLASLDRASAPVTHRLFSRVAAGAADRAIRSRGRFAGAGVNLLTIGEARGIPFRAVFIPGLIERVLPGVVRQDPLLRDEERAALAEAAGGRVSLSPRMERFGEEELLFRLAAGAAEDLLVCSHPRFDVHTGKELVPSSFLRSLGDFTGGPVEERSAPSRRLTAGAGERELAAAVSPAEYDLLQASRVRYGAGFPPVNAFFTRGIELVRARWGTKRFTAYDGVFSSPRALGELGALLDERHRSFSPTSLETYAVCPFAYYLRAVLGLEEREEPGRVIVISPLERGSLVHDILAGLYGEFGERGLLPLDPERRDEIAALTRTVTERFLDAYPRSKPVGLPLFWELERRTIIDSILSFVAGEVEEPDGFTPALFEASFGGTAGGAEVSLESTRGTVRFHGRIDRIDLDAGERFRVVDYKTGTLDHFRDQELRGGTTLQLPIYLLAASRMLDRPVTAGIAQYRRVGTGEGKRFVTYRGERWEEDEPRLARVIDVITAGIERGLFFATPSAQGCRYCPVRGACPSGSARLFAEKALGDERSGELLSLRDGSA